MSPQNLAAQELASGQVEQKPRANIYTMMLILAFVAICVACVLLWMELQAYRPEYWRAKSVAPATSWISAPSGLEAAVWEPVSRSMT